VAVQYDRHRPVYPDELVDRACSIGGLRPGDRVLEVGCGTGQLTRALVSRGLRVTAIEPGERLLELARRNLRGAGAVRFVHATLEEAPLESGGFRAAFAASSFHWVDADVSWQRVAAALAPAGTLALVQYFGLRQEGVDDQAALLATMQAAVPELAGVWPAYRGLEETVAGAPARRSNVSEVWAWLGSYGIAREYAGGLFEDVELATVPALVEHTADELNAALETMSFWARLDPGQRAALVRANAALYERLGRPIRSSTAAVLVTARRRADSRST